jgi:organic hydroperoxide reductase OsmC/OhrA
MLTFVFLASRQGILVDRYRDEAVGIMTKGPNGVPWVSRITLRPAIAFGGSAAPDAAAVGRLHHLAHEQCFIANSVRTEIVVEPAP